MDLWQHFILWGAAILVAILVVNFVMDRFILRRLDVLSNAIKQVGSRQQMSPLPENQADEIGQVTLAFNEMAHQIDVREGENRVLSADLQRQSQERGELLKRIITAQEDERKRLARELHDEMGQALTVLALQTELAHQSVVEKPEQALHILEQVQNLVGETSELMYNMILALRPSALDDLGLAAAIRSHAKRIMGDSGITLNLDTSRFSGRLPADLEIVLYRVFQEALTNILRHAGAKTVEITLARGDGLFLGEIADDGRGFDLEAALSDPTNPRGLGLYGMRERIAEYNGQLTITSAPGRGTRITISIPVGEVEDGKSDPHIDRR
jgi:signal transduction histidine kinase